MYARVTSIECQLEGTKPKRFGVRLDTILGDVNTCDSTVEING
jgi:hypothetical protein